MLKFRFRKAVRLLLPLLTLVFFVVTLAPACAGHSQEGEKAASWYEMADQWKAPEWFQDAKFGIWLHWGPQSVPTHGGGWYARHMYQPKTGREVWGKDAFKHHLKTYGHPSEFGYKDLCRSWKAQYFDADQMVQQFQNWGARYVAVIANHHDNFDLFYSEAQPWNSVNVGPERDIVGEFTKAARKRNLPVELSVHAARAPLWMSPSAKYDGRLNPEDGKGTWWEGMDPHLLYANRLPPRRFAAHFRERLMTLVTEYSPDILYFDDGLIPLGKAGKEPCAELYSRSLKEKGRIETIVTVKMAQKGTLLDLEKGGTPVIRKQPFQMDTTLAYDWFYKEDKGVDNLRHDVRSLTEVMLDTVSKNGSLLLNIAVLGDGRIPDRQKAVMDQFSLWLEAHEEAVFGTRPWLIHGQGGEVGRGHFSERTRWSEPWDSSVVRYTRKGDELFFFVFGESAGAEILLSAFSRGGIADGTTPAGIETLDSNAQLEWTMGAEGLRVSLPKSLKWNHCNGFRIKL